jgi:hypothetical protein
MIVSLQQMGIHLVAAVEKFAQKQERRSYIQTEEREKKKQKHRSKQNRNQIKQNKKTNTKGILKTEVDQLENPQREANNDRTCQTELHNKHRRKNTHCTQDCHFIPHHFTNFNKPLHLTPHFSLPCTFGRFVTTLQKLFTSLQL